MATFELSEPFEGSVVSSTRGFEVEGLRSTWTAVFMLCAMALGVGVFMMPTVFNSVGVVLGLALLVYFGALSSALMLLVVAAAEKREGWEKLIASVPAGAALSDVGMFLAPVIANCAHFQLIGGMLFDMLEWFVTGDFGHEPYGWWKKLTLYSIFIGVALPYTFLEDLSMLRHVGKAVSGVVIATSAAVVAFSISRVASEGVAPVVWGCPSVSTFFRAAPTVCFAYSSMFSLFPVYEAAQRGGGRVCMRRAVLLSNGIQTVIYGVVALTAVLAFGPQAGMTDKGNSAGNVLYNFPPSNYVITVLCVLLVVVIILDYPIINFPIVRMALRRGPSGPFARHAYSVALAVVVIGVDMLVPDLEDVFGLCGSLGISIYCYIVPGLVVWHAYRGWTRVTSVVAVVTGLGMLTVSTFFIVENILRKH